MLPDLPSEILWLIAESLDRQADRYHLAASCRRLYPLLRPTIVSHISLYGVNAISSLLYSIVRDEKLAIAVRSLELPSWDVRGAPWPNDESFEYNAELMHRLVGEVQCSEEEKDQWRKDLESGIDDAWLALLIPRLNGLRSINLNWPHDARYVPDMLARVALEKISPFPRLEEAYSSWWDTENGVDSSLSLPFFKLPAMRKIGGYSVIDDQEGAPPMRRISPITEIDLDNSSGSYGMRTWIESCQALKRVRICFGGAIVSYDEMDTAAIRQSLQLHKTTLESVWICPNEDMHGDRPWTGSWSQFTRLKYLHIGLPDLFGVEDNGLTSPRQQRGVLPPSLEMLYLCYCDSTYLTWAPKQLEGLIDRRELPNWMYLALEWCPTPGMYTPVTQQPLDQLKHRYEAVGIVFNAYSTQEQAALDFNWPFMEGPID